MPQDLSKNHLAEFNAIAQALLDPERYTMQEALERARTEAKADPLLDVRLLELHSGADGAAQRGHLARLFALIDEVSDGTRIVHGLMPYARPGHPPRIRSKAAWIIARGVRNLEWPIRQLDDPDSRLRANVVEGVATWAAGDKAIEFFRQAAKDPHHRVACNALLALCRLGDPDAPEMLETLASHPAPEFRAAAAWAMGQTRDPRFLPTLRQFWDKSEPATRSTALRAMVKIRRR